jgi:hypothetical protein
MPLKVNLIRLAEWVLRFIFIGRPFLPQHLNHLLVSRSILGDHIIVCLEWNVLHPMCLDFFLFTAANSHSNELLLVHRRQTNLKSEDAHITLQLVDAFVRFYYH